MTSANSLHATPTFLDKVRRLYPNGIPESAIVSPFPQTIATPDYLCALLLIHDTEILPPPLSELLDAICSKALRIERERCQVRILPRASDISSITRALSELETPLQLVLGSSIAPGTLEKHDSRAVLFSHGLESIASDPNYKREFWGHLKGFLALR